MYQFAIVVLLGLAAYKVVQFLLDLIREEDPRLRLFLTLIMGIVFTEVLDYSLFAGWSVGVRASWMGPLWTGLIVAGMSYVWDEGLHLLGGFGRRQMDEALEIERRSTPRAA